MMKKAICHFVDFVIECNDYMIIENLKEKIEGLLTKIRLTADRL